MSIEHIKKQAKNLKALFATGELHGQANASLSSCQELVARLHGYPNWHALVTARGNETSEASAPDDGVANSANEADVVRVTVPVPAHRGRSFVTAWTEYLQSGRFEAQIHQRATDRDQALTIGIAAARKLLRVASSDTGQSRKCADFLLAWHNAESNGGWDPFLVSAVDENLGDAMLDVIRMVQLWHVYPSSENVGLRPEIERVWRHWRGRHQEAT